MNGDPNAARSLRSSFWRRANRRETWVCALLVLTTLLVSLKNPNFYRPDNIWNMLAGAAPTAIVACGLTLVIVSGEIDISVGSLLGLLAAVLGVASSARYLDWGPLATVLLVLAAGAAAGLLNGLLVTFGRVPSIIVTLGMMMALQGVTKLVLRPVREWVPCSELHPFFQGLAAASFLGLPLGLWAALATFAVLSVLVHHTPLGRRIYAVGSNPWAARLAGVSATRIKLFVFTLTGFLVGVACLVRVPQLSGVEARIGEGLELLVVTCVVVGGTSISGGRGTLSGSMLAVLLLSNVGLVLLFLRISATATYWEQAIQGGFILAAVLADRLAHRRAREVAA
jgi:ribose/xylose/arabinose/galactoside ABC-type transport system permease subunit